MAPNLAKLQLSVERGYTDVPFAGPWENSSFFKFYTTFNR